MALLNRGVLGRLGWLSKLVREKAKHPQDVHGPTGWPLKTKLTVLKTAIDPAEVAPSKDQRAIGVPAVDEVAVVHVDNHSSLGVVFNGRHDCSRDFRATGS